MTTKKLMNDAGRIVDEMLDGILAAYPGHLKRLDSHPRAVVATDSPRPGKVGIVVGGGSGHEPTFIGCVGRGLADAVAVGNVFASPPPDPILECARAVNQGAGVLFLYGNYAGDCMNFDMAAEMAGLEDIEVRTVVTTDDIASAPKARQGERRGVAGSVFVFKVTGAAADRMQSLEACERIARRANAATCTVGVALAPCSLPQTLQPNFTIGLDEMEVGMGIHGEPGVARSALQSADRVVDDIMDRIFAESPAGRGDAVAVLVNSLGSTSMMELFVLNRRVRQRLADRGLAVHRTVVGPYCTSLEMAGASISMMALDSELTSLLDHPANGPMARI